MKKNLLLLSIFMFLCSSCNRDGTQGGAGEGAGGGTSSGNEQEDPSFSITLKLIDLDDPSANQAIFRSKAKKGQRIARVGFKQGGCVTLRKSDFKSLSIQIGKVLESKDWVTGDDSKLRISDLHYECSNSTENKCVSTPDHYTLEVQTNYWAWVLWWGYEAELVVNKAADSQKNSACVPMKDVIQ